MTATTDAGRPSERAGRARPARRAQPALVETLSSADAAVYAIAAIAGVFGVIAADAAPTGIGWWDAILRAAFVASVSLACSRARRWTWFLILGVAAVFSESVVWTVVAGIGLAITIVMAFSKNRSRTAGAVVGALGGLGLLHLGPVGFFGLPTILAIMAVVPAYRSGYRYSRRRARRWIRTGLMVAGAAVVAVGAVTLIGVLLARDDAERGVSAARSGLEAARDGDQDLAVERLLAAEEALEGADSTLGAFWMAPGRLLPVASQHLDTLEALVSTGAEVSARASSAATSADLDDLRVADGALDLNQVKSMRVPLQQLTDSLTSARARMDEIANPWLVPLVEDKIDELTVEVDGALPDAELALMATQAVPDLMGDAGTRRYLVLFGTPSEARELGGIVGNFIELEVRDGEVEITRTGDNNELTRAGPGLLSEPESYPTRFLTNLPDEFAQNYTGMPDFPNVARAVGDLYPSMGGRDIDGVMYVDPYALAALLELTGPIRLEGLDFPLTAENTAQFLLVDQYELFPDRATRKDFLTDISTAAFDQLLLTELPGPRRLGDVLGPAARQDRLLMSTFDDDANAFLAEVELDGQIPAATDRADFLSVVHANGAANKLDTYIERTVLYSVDLDAGTGELTAEATIEVTNTAPAGLPEYVTGADRAPGRPAGTSLVQLSIYTPHILDELTVAGEPAQAEPQQEFGYERYLVFVPVEPGQTVPVRFDLTGGLDLSSGSYVLNVASQPLVNDDDVSIRVRVANGTIEAATAPEPTEGQAHVDFVVAGAEASADFILVEDTILGFGISGAEPT